MLFKTGLSLKIYNDSKIRRSFVLLQIIYSNEDKFVKPILFEVFLYKNEFVVDIIEG